MHTILCITISNLFTCGIKLSLRKTATTLRLNSRNRSLLTCFTRVEYKNSSVKECMEKLQREETMSFPWALWRTVHFFARLRSRKEMNFHGVLLWICWWLAKRIFPSYSKSRIVFLKAAIHSFKTHGMRSNNFGNIDYKLRVANDISSRIINGTAVIMMPFPAKLY